MDYVLINNLKEDYFKSALSHRRQFHSNPELSFKEYETAEYIRNYLKQHKIEHFTIAETGTIALIGSKGPCIALRADIDALPINEETSLPFASKNANVMHACGHDLHTASLLETARYLKEHQDELNCTVKLIFQPAEEEQPGGAIKIIEEGGLDNPKVDAIYAVHIFPEIETGKFAIAAGPVMASTNEIYIEIFGKGGHAAQPHLGGDAILASSVITNYYQHILSKFRNPIQPAVISIASIDGRSAVNAFPNKVSLKGVMRCYEESLRKKIINIICERTPILAELYDCKAEVTIVNGYPAVINDYPSTLYAEKCASKIVGEVNILQFEPKMWAEDFAHYTNRVPGALIFAGSALDINNSFPLHNSLISPDENAMLYIMAYFIELCKNYRELS